MTFDSISEIYMKQKGASKETEDAKYNVGDISQKTGLQKQSDGTWAPPKNGANKATKNETKRYDPAITAGHLRSEATKESAEYNAELHTYNKNTPHVFVYKNSNGEGSDKFIVSTKKMNNGEYGLELIAEYENGTKKTGAVTREKTEAKYGPLKKSNRDGDMHTKDVGPLPESEQKRYFETWDSVIESKFKDQYRTQEARKKGVEKWDVSAPDMEFDKNTGVITIWTNKGKEYFKTTISGIQTTVVDPVTGEAKKQHYSVYHKDADGGKDFDDSISFEFAGSKGY